MSSGWVLLLTACRSAPSITAYFDVGDEKDGGGDGEYYVLSASQDLSNCRQKQSMTIGADLGYNNNLFIEENGISDFTPYVSIAWEFNEHFTGRCYPVLHVIGRQ